MASTASQFRSGQVPATKSRFGDFIAGASGPTSASSGINADIWGLTPNTTSSYNRDNRDNELRGSSSLEQSSVPDNSFPRPSSSSAAAWATNGAPAGFNGGSGTISPLRQRTTQNTRSNSPFTGQHGHSAVVNQSRLNPETSNFDPSSGNSYFDFFGGSNTASRASSQHRNASSARAGFGDFPASLNGHNSQSVSRNGSYPASRQGNEPSPTEMSFNPYEVNERLPTRQMFDSLDRPQSQGRSREMWFGSVPANRRPSAPYLNSAYGSSFNGMEAPMDTRSVRTGSMSSNGGAQQFGTSQNTEPYQKYSNESGSGLELPNVGNLSLSVHLQGPHGLPILTGNDLQRSNSNANSTTQSRNPTFALNQLRQNGNSLAQVYNDTRNNPQFRQNAYYQAQEQLLRNNQIANPQMAAHLSHQTAPYGGYNNSSPYWNQTQMMASQRATHQHAYYNQDTQSRSYYPQSINTQVPRGPARSSKGNRADGSSPDGPCTLKYQGNNWAQMLKANGSTFIEATNECRPKDVIGHVDVFCGDQAGSRLIQEMIESASNEDKEAIFQEMLPNTIPLCLDPFGNYVIQKFFEYGVQRQKQELASQMKGKIVDLSKHAFGCRCVQKAFEHILLSQRLELVEELRPCLQEIAKDAQGNHVVQKVLQNMNTQHVQFILNGFEGQVVAMSNDPFACRVIQRLLEVGDENSKPRLVGEIIRYADALMRNPYGNYVVQHVLDRGTREDKNALVVGIIEHIPDLIYNKYSSNVVERCLENGTEEQRDRIVAKLSEVDQVTKQSRHLREAMISPYANYVIQRTLKTLGPGKWEPFAELVETNLVWMATQRSHDKKCAEFERLLKRGPNETRDGIHGHGFQAQLHMNRTTMDSGSQGAGTPPPLTRTQPSPQSSSAPSTSNSTVDGPIGSVASGPGSNESGETVVEGKVTEMTTGHGGATALKS